MDTPTSEEKDPTSAPEDKAPPSAPKITTVEEGLEELQRRQAEGELPPEEPPEEPSTPPRPRVRGRALAPDEVTLIQRCFSEGWTYEEIRKEHGFSPMTIRKYTQGLKRPGRPRGGGRKTETVAGVEKAIEKPFYAKVGELFKTWGKERSAIILKCGLLAEEWQGAADERDMALLDFVALALDFCDSDFERVAGYLERLVEQDRRIRELEARVEAMDPEAKRLTAIQFHLADCALERKDPDLASLAKLLDNRRP